MNPFRALRQVFINQSRSVQVLEEIRQGIANLTDVLNQRLIEAGSNSSTARSVQLLEEIREGIANLTDVTDRSRAEGEAARVGVANLTDVLNQRLLELGLNIRLKHDAQIGSALGAELASVSYAGPSSSRSQESHAGEKELPMTEVGGLRFEKRKL